MCLFSRHVHENLVCGASSSGLFPWKPCHLVFLRYLLFSFLGSWFLWILLTSFYWDPSVGVTSNLDWNWEEILENHSWPPFTGVILMYNFHVKVTTRNLKKILNVDLLKKFLMFIYFWDRDRVWVGEGQRKRETQNPKQDPGSQRSAQQASNPRTVRSWPELKSDA